MDTTNTDPQIHSVLRRVERVLTQWQHLYPWVESLVTQAENQQWRKD